MGYLPYEFLLPEFNKRNDAYGGSVANRVRLVRELMDATREAARGTCAVALRISLAELRRRPAEHAESEAHAVVDLLKDDPDLFDVKLDMSSTDCVASRFGPEGSHEATIDFVKRMTTRPVVGVGRFTSPDTMVSQVRRGILDLIGAARPSIADPFLPRKIAEGREDEIRECIGCNMCIASWHDGVPVRCTQNPTAGEEWRRGWHPEHVESRPTSERVLVVGAGPAGLEAALVLARRGFAVTLADKAGAAGGRLRFESRLPGLSAWHCVVDYRLGRLRVMPNVEFFFGSDLTADDVLEFGAEHVVLATGARWLPALYDADEFPRESAFGHLILTPNDLAAGAAVSDPVVVYDFDNYYMGGAVAEMLAARGHAVTYATSAGMASNWTIMTNELPGVHRAFASRRIALETRRTVVGFDGATLRLGHIFTDETAERACRTLVVVGHRAAESGLYEALDARRDEVASAGIRTLARTGDAQAPGALAHAIHQAHKTARELGVAASEVVPLRDEPFVAGVPTGPRPWSQATEAVRGERQPAPAA